LTKTPNNELRDLVLKIDNQKKPRSLSELMPRVQETFNHPQNKVSKSVLKLQARGEITHDDQIGNSRIPDVFVSSKTLNYLLTIAAATVTAIIVFLLPQSLYPWIYIRNFLGVIFVLFLPGYAFQKVLFPVNLPGEATSDNSLEIIERIGLSVGLSIALVSLVGLLLYYSPWKLDLTPIVLSLFALTLIFGTAGFARENQASKAKLSGVATKINI